MEKSRYPSKLISYAPKVASKLIPSSAMIGSNCSGLPSWQRATSIPCVSFVDIRAPYLPMGTNRDAERW